MYNKIHFEYCPLNIHRVHIFPHDSRHAINFKPDELFPTQPEGGSGRFIVATLDLVCPKGATDSECFSRRLLTLRILISSHDEGFITQS